MTAPDIIKQLVEQFERDLQPYRSAAYKEMQLREGFLNPFFEALGWDMSNKSGKPFADREVIHEDAVKIEGEAKSSDYAFIVGRERKFFVEAKKPFVKIESDTAPAYQLRRYAWHKSLPLSILTDFEEFAVYDCRFMPKQGDQASMGRVMLMSFRDYLERWDEIADIFSREAVGNGSFDKYAEAVKSKKGTIRIDEAFLADIEKWRDVLARNIVLRTPDLSVPELNYAVQVTIDRVIFLRICEDRGIERDGQLQELLEGKDIYEGLIRLFQKADARYNSGLFHFKNEKEQSSPADSLTLKLKIDDKALKEILERMYPPSPYMFKEIPTEILGKIYEQFLGKVIRLTAGGYAKVEVKKAGGVFYTPTFIVSYIVINTLGKLLESREQRVVTPKEVAKLRIVDPACGSGTFLLGAYQYLLDWHLNWYMANDPEKWTTGKKPALYFSKDRYYLTGAKKKEILLNNIYGVDIDAQAVEVTKLSLLLKVLEDESNETIGSQLALFQERVLPDLGKNIKCGNSLIGHDYWEGQLMVSEEEKAKVNAFDWKAAFPDVFAQGGFDVVIGNPPYIFTREQISDKERDYYSSHYIMSWEKQNTFMLFMEHMLRILSAKGKGGFIVPNSWLTIESAKNIRPAFIPKLELLADLNYQVFKKVSMEPCVFIISGQDLQSKVSVLRAKSTDEFEKATPFEVNREQWLTNNHRIVFSNSINSDVIGSIEEKSQMVGDVFDVRTGLQAYEEGKGNPPQSAKDVKDHVFDRDKWEDKNSFKYLQGKDVGRYSLAWSGMWMQYGSWLSQPREFQIFSRPRILLREITSDFPRCLNTSFVTGDFLNNKSVLNILHPLDSESDLKMLAAILNSRLISLYYKSRAVKSERKIFPKVVIKNLREFPYPKNINHDDKQTMVSLVERMLELHKRNPRTPQEKESLAGEVASVDRAIDELVYQLYGLSPEEINIVEGRKS
jgi:type I restriction-modification system DNA methylase subunit